MLCLPRVAIHGRYNTVIPVELRKKYMQPLEYVSVSQDIQPFSKLLGNLVKKTLEGSPLAMIE